MATRTADRNLAERRELERQMETEVDTDLQDGIEARVEQVRDTRFDWLLFG